MNEDRVRPNFGDKLTNIQASDCNPTKHGMFVRVIRRTGRLNPGTFYEMTDGKGDFWICPKENMIPQVSEALT